MRSLAHLALLGLVCAKNVNNALQPEASDGPLLLKPADYANWPNFTSCVRTSSCPETALVTGDPDSDLVVIFMHTTFDGGWIFMHALLNGWNPSFYAVALDLPGDISKKPVDYDSSCEGLTLNCSKGFNDVVASFHADVQRFAPPGKRLAFVGHSLGGVLMQEYIMRELQPAPERIVLINNPTAYVWSMQVFWDYSNQTCPGLPEPPLNNHYSTYVGKNIPNVSDNQGTMVPLYCIPPACWQCENDYLTQMNADWLESPNYWQTTTWYEDYQAQNLLRQCGRYKPLAIPHMVIEGIVSSDNVSALSYLDNRHVGNAEDQCKLASGLCKYEYVECMPSGDDSASGTSGLPAWWPHIDNVSYTRGLIEEYIA